jgi:error-prone DNA polymerase
MGVVMARDLRRVKAEQTVLVTGILIIVRTPPTKSVKGTIFITAEEGMRLLEVVAFPKVLDKYARVIRTRGVLIVKGRLQRQGSWGKSLSIVTERVIVPWGGLLSELLLKKFSWI